MRIIRFVHRWLGIVMAAPLLLMGLTGIVLTLEPVWPDGGPAVTGHGAALPANQLLRAAVAAAPPGTRLVRLLPARPGDAVRLVYAPEDDPRGRATVLRLDPATALPLGPPRPVSALISWSRGLHQNLLLPQFGGRQVAGWFGVGLLLVVILGVPLWWPRPGQLGAALTPVPRGARGLRLHRALHGASGAWLSLLLLVTATTGITQGFPQTTRAVLGIAGAGPRAASPPGGRPESADVDLDAAFGLAKRVLPGLEPRAALLPRPSEPLRIVMSPPGGDGAITNRIVVTNRAGTRLISAQTGSSAGETVIRWAHDLHEGVGLGPVWRGLVVLTGLVLPGLAVTGLLVWVLKRRNRRRVSALRAVAIS